MIKLFKNPKTNEYCLLKEKVLGPYFSWFYHDTCTSTNLDGFTNNPIYNHEVLTGPNPSNGVYFSTPRSDMIQLCDTVISQILQVNNIDAKFVHRIGLNCVHYYDGNPSVPHLDHEDFPHNNLIFYFNQFDDGAIDVFDKTSKETYFPNEDDIIAFPGLYHSIHQPKKGDRRVVMAVTFS